MSLTGSSVLGLGGGCLGIPILAPTALEREKSSDWPMGWSRLLVWLAPRSRRRQVESYDHAQHWDEGGEVAAVIASSRRRRRPAHQARHVHQHHPLGHPPLFPSLDRPIDPDGRSCCCEGWHDGRRRAATKRLTTPAGRRMGGGGASGALAQSNKSSYMFFPLPLGGEDGHIMAKVWVPAASDEAKRRARGIR